MKNIILVGFMGSGKTTIAFELSRRLNMRYVSTDDLIEKKEKCTINEIFTKKGEDYFRNVETLAVRDACSMENVIIDLGGGAVIRDENWESIKASGVAICLTADENTIMERTKKYKHRPLLNVEDPKQKIRNLMAKRALSYAKADYCVDTGKLTVKQTVEKIAGIIEEYSRKAGTE
ncbi:MAG: shikimate kinase [Candidatus Omnitrophica bacterium]|nr:shikimate kinase [Candidatus Omnitrophota bacterium]